MSDSTSRKPYFIAAGAALLAIFVLVFGVVVLRGLGGDDDSDVAGEDVEAVGLIDRDSAGTQDTAPLAVALDPATGQAEVDSLSLDGEDVVTVGGAPAPDPGSADSAAPSGDVVTGQDASGSMPDTTAPTSTTSNPEPTAAPSRQPAPGSNQTELYVDGQNGSDQNPGTKEQPFRRPIDAARRAKPGTTIYLRGGRYDTNTHGAFSIRDSGTAQNWIRIAAYPGENVELSAGGEFGSAIEVIGASYIEIAGFTMKGRDDSIHGSGVFVNRGAHDVRVVDNKISGFGGAGISIVESTNVTIEGNEVRDNAHRSHYQGSGITVFEPAGPLPPNDAYSIVVRGNYVVGNYNAVVHLERQEHTDGNCIIIDRSDTVGFQGKTLIENNICVENGGRGIASYRSSNMLVRNNTLVRDNWDSEVLYYMGEVTAVWGANLTYVNNLVVNRSDHAPFISNRTEDSATHINNYVASDPPAESKNKAISGNKVLSDPSLFSSTSRDGPASQYRPGSALAGTADGSRQPSYDFFGKQRPSTGAVGAVEP